MLCMCKQGFTWKNSFLVNYFAYQVVGGGEGNFHVLLGVAGKNYTMYDFAKNSRNVEGAFEMGWL